MKKLYLLFLLSIGLLSLNAQVVVTTGNSYANDVYYSFENGTIATVDRSNWDIAFHTSRFSVSVLSNFSAGVEVYTYSLGDSSSWSTLDTNGMSWNLLYNSIETWDEGAFNRNSTGHPDYGWGVYNMGNHHIVGDSIYIVKTLSGNYKKLFIQQKDAFNNIWKFKFANLDGSNIQAITLDASTYDTKNFVYYNLDNNTIEDREPASASWDLLFTKYYDASIPYHVTGVLSNDAHVTMEEVSQSGLNQATYTTYTEANLSSDIHIAGSDWKDFDMGTFAYVVSDTTVFFAKTFNSNGDSLYYKFYFTDFAGMSTGEYSFMQELLLHSNIANSIANQELSIFPNPVKDIVSIENPTNSKGIVRVTDLQGRVLMEERIRTQSPIIEINLSALAKGSYLVQFNNNSSIIIKH